MVTADHLVRIAVLDLHKALVIIAHLVTTVIIVTVAHLVLIAARDPLKVRVIIAHLTATVTVDHLAQVQVLDLHKLVAATEVAVPAQVRPDLKSKAILLTRSPTMTANRVKTAPPVLAQQIEQLVLTKSQTRAIRNPRSKIVT